MPENCSDWTRVRREMQDEQDVELMYKNTSKQTAD